VFNPICKHVLQLIDCISKQTLFLEFIVNTQLHLYYCKTTWPTARKHVNCI